VLRLAIGLATACLLILNSACGGSGSTATPVVVPDVVGQTQAAAGSAITAVGLAVGTVTMQSSGAVVSGNVISETPAAGASVASGSAVALVISTGRPAQTTVPNLIGDSEAAASNALTAANLSIGTVTSQQSNAPFGDIISETPAAGSTVASGSAVSLVVSNGPPVAVPNLTGATFDAALAAINQVNLRLGQVTAQPSTTVADGSVISQTPAAGTSVSELSAVNLVISTTEAVLYSFGATNVDGTGPMGGVIQGTDGNFYGTTASGGAHGAGTVFKVTPQGVETVLYSFGTNPSDGASPNAALIQGKDGSFYGTTAAGGGAIRVGGTVFKITPTGTETVLYSFGASSTDGMLPEGGVIQGTDGNFYGTTLKGGTNGDGSVFKITPAGVETVLYSFGSSSADGAGPVAGLIQGMDGNFYGTTVSSTAGTNRDGTVFKVTPAGVETVLHFFSGADGRSPTSGLFERSDGNFYGATEAGGNEDLGTIFKITPAGVESVLHSFLPGDAFFPRGSLIESTDGNLYGTTIYGGANGYACSPGGTCNMGDGTVFKIPP
jgi:uncharacterized repeat protein (TIGR03803 family)